MEQIWTSDTEGSLKGVPFRFQNFDYDKLQTTDEEIVVLKSRDQIARYLENERRAPIRRMVEVGVFEGGGALLFADMFPEAKIVGIDWKQGSPAIQRHIERMGYADRVKLYWGVSQDDQATIARILDAEFGGEPLDFVIDDCSHLYGYTTRSFDILYPRLRVGGTYAIEDWGWACWPDFQLPQYFTEEQKPLTAMILELALAIASRHSLGAELQITNAAQVSLTKLGELPPFNQLVKSNAPFRWVGFDKG